MGRNWGASRGSRMTNYNYDKLPFNSYLAIQSEKNELEYRGKMISSLLYKE